jgi:nitrilase
MPSAFTAITGAAHWEVLIRARAIETQTYIAAADQVGPVEGGHIQAYGRSMIVDPWGAIVAQASDGEGLAAASINLDYVASVRNRMPVASHRRITGLPDGGQNPR